ncbi:MAG TPA: hypothetical protein VK569_05125 [Bacteroidota bacterium]|nr:hypothetical protein [Bacteroidota bacterium]
MTLLRAENKFSLSAGAGPAFPIRGLKKMVGPGYGAGGSLDLQLNDNISIVARGGYYRWQFDSEKINASLAANGGVSGFDVSGPFVAIPLLVGGNLTFDGSSVRPYFGLSGGICLLRWRIAGTAPGGAPLAPSGEHSSSWTEPAMSVDAGLRFVLSPGVSLDVGGIYIAFSNADNRSEPPEILGTMIPGTNTATFIGVLAGLHVAF